MMFRKLIDSSTLFYSKCCKAYTTHRSVFIAYQVRMCLDVWMCKVCPILRRVIAMFCPRFRLGGTCYFLIDFFFFCIFVDGIEFQRFCQVSWICLCYGDLNVVWGNVIYGWIWYGFCREVDKFICFLVSSCADMG